MRIYVVKMGDVERLVEANTPSQAVMHVASGVIEARAAKPADVARVLPLTGKVEAIKEAEHGGA